MLPLARSISRMLPWFLSLQLVYSSLRPSRLKCGWYSKAVLSAVRRVIAPPGRLRFQRWPTAWNTTVLPSGEVATSRSIFGVKLSPSSVWLKRIGAVSFCCTSALNAIGLGLPLAMSTRQSLPCAQITTDCESGVQLKLAYGPKIAHTSCMSCERPSQTGVTLPVLRSRTCSTVLSRTRFTKARRLPSGEGCGRMAPPGVFTSVSVSPVSRSSRLIA